MIPTFLQAHDDVDARSEKKANLHIHLTGSLTSSDLRYLAILTKVDLSAHEPLESHFKFTDPAIWSLAKDVTSSQQGLEEAMKHIFERESGDNVTYLELTINTAGMVRRGMSPEVIADAVTEAFTYAESLGVKGKIKCGVNRKDGPESVSTVRKTYLALAEQHRAGIDLNGNERMFPTKSFVREFEQLASEGIPTIVHAGEYPELLESLKDALDMRPARIAHAVAAAKDDDTVQRILEQGVLLEITPTSNIYTQAVSDAETHPVVKFLKYGIPVVLGNDDSAFFAASMTDEFNALLDIGIDRETLLTINARGLSFAN